MSYTPFECLAVAKTTPAGLLHLEEKEITLGMVPDAELRSTNELTPIDENNDIVVNPGVYKDRTRATMQVTVTTHRIVVQDETTFRFIHLSNVFQLQEETLMFKSPKLVVSCSLGDLILAFPGGSDRTKRRDDCYDLLIKSWRRKQWEQESTSTSAAKKPRERKVGVDAIFSAHEKRHQNAAQLTDTAFEGDVEQLLKEATDLVQIIRKYVATLDKHETGTDEGDHGKLVSMLQDMGMTAALRKEDAASDVQFYQHTARQLADFLRPKFTQTNTMLTLTDIYCWFNRARGSNLISPEDLLETVKQMEKLQLGMKVHTFDSGLTVLRDVRTSDAELAKRILNACGDQDYVTSVSLSRVMHVPAVLAWEQLQMAERGEYLVRDETLEATRFYPNRFKDF